MRSGEPLLCNGKKRCLYRVEHVGANNVRPHSNVEPLYVNIWVSVRRWSIAGCTLRALQALPVSPVWDDSCGGASSG